MDTTMLRGDSSYFEADRPSGWNASAFENFVIQRAWKVARTMPANPHEYTLRAGTRDSTFDSAVRYIREHGVIEYFAGKPYKTLYSGDHKFWTMGALLEETTLINRKPRLADIDAKQASPALGEVLQLEVAWRGPFSWQAVVSDFNEEGAPPDYDGEDYGLYQIYGRHILCGPDTLLYIGQATGQTFARRFRQHQEWLEREEEVTVYLGRIYDSQRHTATDLWKSWAADVRLAECVLIYKYSPNYNAISISDPPPLGGYRSVDLIHQGERHKLSGRDSAPTDW